MNCVPKTPAKYSKNELISKIENFYLVNKRIPVKKEFYSLWQAYRRVFGNWNNSIVAAGFVPNPELFSKKFIAKDNHVCDSLAEKIIDDWLSARKIHHDCHVYYPNQNRFRTDFLINNRHWIEFLGLKGQLRSYDVLYKQKLETAKKNGIQIIEILPQDLFPNNHLSEKLAFLLK